MIIENKMKLIVVLVIAILLGLFVVSVTAQTISQYQQSCHEEDTSQNTDGSPPYSSEGCHRQQYRSCCNPLPLRGCC